MDFDLSEEHEAFRKVVRDFAEQEIAPHAEVWDRDHVFPVEVVQAMGELGLFGLPFPQEYGGSGADFTTLCVAIEEVARVDSSMAITLEAAVGLGAAPDRGVRHRGATPAVVARPLRGTRAGRIRAHRARRGQRRRRVPYTRAPRGRRLGDRRHEGVHHQLGHAHHRVGDGDRAHRLRA